MFKKTALFLRGGFPYYQFHKRSSTKVPRRSLFCLVYLLFIFVLICSLLVVFGPHLVLGVHHTGESEAVPRWAVRVVACRQQQCLVPSQSHLFSISIGDDCRAFELP